METLAQGARLPEAVVQPEGSPANGRDSPRTVEEDDPLDLSRCRCGDRQAGAALQAGRAQRKQPAHCRAPDAADVDPLDRRVREDVRSDLVDVLRLLVVGGESSAAVEAASHWRRRAWDREK